MADSPEAPTSAQPLRETLASVIGAVSEEYDADVFLYSREIDPEGYGNLISEVTEHKKRDNVLLILVTNGGSAHAAYQIARFLQKTYCDGKFILWAPSYCKSAGTLVAIGAHRLLMDTFAELGPLDVQLLKADEIGARKSGLLSGSTFQALEEASFGLFEHLMLEMKKRSFDLISFKLAAEISSRMVGKLMAGIYSQISPDVVGSDYRDLRIAKEYGRRLALYGGNIDHNGVNHLVEGFPSHDFVIDDDEARAIFESVEVPSGGLYDLARFFGDIAYNEDPDGTVYALARFAKLTQDDDDDKANPKDMPSSDPSGTSGLDESRDSDRGSDQQAELGSDDSPLTHNSGTEAGDNPPAPAGV